MTFFLPFKFIYSLIKKNIQFNQTLTLSMILLLWINIYNLNISFFQVFVVFSTVITTDFLINWYKTWKIFFPYSWLNSWFWISFFLRATDTILFFWAWIIAILVKHFFTTALFNDNKPRHFFNPSNFAVFITLILFPAFTWINPLQWWNYVDSIYYYIILLVIIILGIRMQFKCKSIIWESTLPVIISFFLSSIIMFFFFAQESYNSALSFFTWSFFTFIFFMITDPKTVPENFINKILFWIWITFFFYILQYFINENYSILWWLFFMTILLPFIWFYESKDKKWKYLNKFKITFSNKILFYFLIILFLIIIIFSYYNWIPDLVFDNRCLELFCS